MYEKLFFELLIKSSILSLSKKALLLSFAVSTSNPDKSPFKEIEFSVDLKIIEDYMNGADAKYIKSELLKIVLKNYISGLSFRHIVVSYKKILLHLTHRFTLHAIAHLR